MTADRFHIFDDIRSKMSESDLEASPSNYELLHSYLTEQDESVVVAINDIRERQGKLDEQAMATVARATGRYLTGPQAMKIARNASAQLQKTSQAVDQNTRNLIESGSALSATARSLPATIANDPAVQRLSAIAEDMTAEATGLRDIINRAREEIAALHSELQATREAAETDPLTGLPNRRMLEAHLKSILTKSKKERRSCAVAMLDIDHFKSINDSHGHDVGDDVLRYLADSFSKIRRPDIVAGRWGGEEFLVVLEGRDATEAYQVLEAFRREVSSRPLMNATTSKAVGKLTFSTGIASFPERPTMAGMLKSADTALYRAKRDGRDAVAVACRGE